MEAYVQGISTRSVDDLVEARVAAGSGDPAVLIGMHDEWIAGDRRYLSEASMAKLDTLRDPDPVAAIVDSHRQRRPVGTEDHLKAHHPAGLCR